MSSINMSNIVFPPAVTVNVLESAREASDILKKSSLYVSAFEILETQGHELELKEGLPLVEYKDLMSSLPCDTKIQAKASTAYEIAALTEIEKLKTLEECADLADQLYFSGNAHDRFAQRCTEFQTAQASALLAGPDEFRPALQAHSLLPWQSPLRLQAIEKLARSARDLDECWSYVYSLNPQTSVAHFDAVFDRALGLCTTREQLQRFEQLLRNKEKHTWDEMMGRYNDRLGEEIAKFNRSRIPNLKSFEEVVGLKYESRGSGPISRKVAELILARAIELANLQQFHDLLKGSGWDNNAALKAKGMKKWETLAQSEVERTNGHDKLTALLEYLPFDGSAMRNCLLKIVEAQTSPEAALGFFREHCNDEEVSAPARKRYEDLIRIAMKEARTPNQIIKALAVCDNLPEVRKEGLVKLAAFYQIPEACAA